tara:strand:+ start:1254 stop:1940 length:687 start_codon:yes stop_codon:yes gene_type:complete
MQHLTIEPLSSAWYMGLAISIASAILLYYILSKKNINTDKKTGCILFGIFLFNQLYLIFTSSWTLQESIPLHLCNLSYIMSCLLLIYKKQFYFEWVLYFGIASGINAILTPELTHGTDIWKFSYFYISHTLLIILPFIMIKYYNFFPRQNSWLKFFIIINALVPFIYSINVFLNSNYMYLNQKPEANNPFLIGEWPWYILGLEFVVFIFLLIIYMPFVFLNKKRNIWI